MMNQQSGGRNGRGDGTAEQRRTQRSFAGSMLTRAALLAAALVASTVVLMVMAGGQVVEAFERANAGTRLQQGERVFTQLMQETELGLRPWMAWLAEQPAAPTAAQPDRREDFVLQATSLAALWNVDYVALADSAGKIMAASPLPQALPDLSPEERLSDSAAGWVLPADGLPHWRVVTAFPGEGEPSYLIAGLILGDDFVAEFKDRTGLDSAVIQSGRIQATSLTLHGDEPGLFSRGAAAGRSLPVEVGNRRYMARYIPLEGRQGQTTASLGLIAPETVLREQESALIREIVPYLLEIVVLAGLSAYVLSKGVYQPLATLTGAVARMRRGDLSTPLQVKASREIEALAVALDEMRQKLREALDNLAIEKSLYQGIVQSMADGVYTTDLDGQVAAANPVAETMLGSSNQQGLDCRTVCGLADAAGSTICDRYCQPMGQQDAPAPIRVKTQWQPPGADPLDVEMTITPIYNDQGQPVGLVHVLRDISAVEELQRAKTQFLLSVAHELRTPLAALTASIDILAADLAVMTQDDRDYIIAAIHRASLRLRHLITNLLDAGSIEAGRFMVQLRPGDLRAWVEEAVLISWPLLAAKNQSAKTVMPPTLPPVLADSERISQVLMNLLTTCSKYAPDGDSFEIIVDPQPGRLRVTVSDHGPGISAEEAAHLFEYYYRGSRNTAEGVQGFGLGLAIVKGIITAHGGQIGVDSAPGEGTNIWFTLPLAPPRAQIET